MIKTVKRVPLDTLELTADSEGKTSQNPFKNRQLSKALTKSINGKLCYLDSEIHKDYQAAYYCNDFLFQDGKKVVAQYCRKRNCIVCARVKAAKLMSGYAEPILALPDLFLVTLTTPNVKAENLRSEIDYMYKAIRKISDNIRKNYKSHKLKGFRKLEITFNDRTVEFNPHYHIIVSGQVTANLVLDQWLNQFSKADLKGQDIKRIKDGKGLLEVFKYVTKAIVKDTFNAKALDQMYKAIKGVRTYQAMGIKKVKDTDVKPYESTEITHRSERVDVWKWCNKKKDWYTIEGEKFNDSFIDLKTKSIIKLIDKTKLDHEEQTKGKYNEFAVNEWRQKNRSYQEIEWD